ncbi:MAG: NAD-dependent epimerase/dehydratase family protein [Gemmataceae bacterium]
MTTDTLPDTIRAEAELEEVMTRPRPVLVEFMKTVSSPLYVLGAGGKMGPTLAVLARRAADAAGRKLDVVAVSRFSDERARRTLEEQGVLTRSVDLLDRHAVAKLDDATDIVYLVGLKFGTTENAAPTWAINTLVPANVCERFPKARIVALSSGNVYPFVTVASGGSVESDGLTPLGEYPNAAVARERIFEYFSQKNGTRVATIRLNYAVDLRYGVLVDIARQIWAGSPLDVTMGHLNCIWQGDANEIILRALDLAASPVSPLNLTGRIVRIRDLAEKLGVMLGKQPQIVGREAPTALLSNPSRMEEKLGPPATSLDTMLRWTADWIQQGGRLLDKPTHFEVRDGKY